MVGDRSNRPEAWAKPAHHKIYRDRRGIFFFQRLWILRRSLRSAIDSAYPNRLVPIQITRYNRAEQGWLPTVMSLREEFGGGHQPEPFVAFIQRRLEDETMCLILAWDGDIPVGYGLAFDVESDPAKPEWTRTGYISQFLVTNSRRKQGVGKLLMGHIDAWFESRGIARVLLNVDIENDSGLRFWEDNGFEQIAIRMKRIRRPATGSRLRVQSMPHCNRHRRLNDFPSKIDPLRQV